MAPFFIAVKTIPSTLTHTRTSNVNAGEAVRLYTHTLPLQTAAHENRIVGYEHHYTLPHFAETICSIEPFLFVIHSLVFERAVRVLEKSLLTLCANRIKVLFEKFIRKNHKNKVSTFF